MVPEVEERKVNRKLRANATDLPTRNLTEEELKSIIVTADSIDVFSRQVLSPRRTELVS
jgi:hypothetical protein